MLRKRNATREAVNGVVMVSVCYAWNSVNTILALK